MRPLVRCLGVLLVLSLMPAGSARAATRYVWTNSPSPGDGHLSWATAAHTIQAAVDAAASGDTILVTNGTYAAGGHATYGTMTNRVALTNTVTVRSVNGPQVTIIMGHGPAGSAAVRCAYVGSGCVLAGFTLTNGTTRADGDRDRERSGGGVWSDGGGRASNCWMLGNSASYHGGGAYGGALGHCTLAGNDAFSGGGAYGSTLTDCTLAGNDAPHGDGGGACTSTLKQCTLTGNSARHEGGGAARSTLHDCTLVGNSASHGGGAEASTLSQCTFTSNSASSSGGGAEECLLTNCTLIGNSANSGGGAEESTLNNCTLSGNSASYYGGGAEGSALNRCTLVGNSANSGGGADASTLTNCMLAGNSALDSGGGAYGGQLYNCTLVGNSATNSGGGTRLSTLYNCILWDNTAPSSNNAYRGTLRYCCTTPDPGGSGNITNAPRFADTNAADYRLQPNSPCVNAGTNQPWMNGATDLDRRPRIIGGRVDMGAYQSTNGATAGGIPWGWLLDHGLPTDDTADRGDTDADGLPNLGEYAADTDPTNAASRLAITAIQTVAGGMRVDWQGGVGAWQYLQRTDGLGPTNAEWQTIFTNPPPTPLATAIVDNHAANAKAFYRIKAARDN